MTARKPSAPVRRGSAPKRSANIPEGEREARGQGRLNLRIPLPVLALLDGESERSGYTCSELVEEMIRIELDPSHEGYVGSPKAVRCRTRTGYVRCTAPAMGRGNPLCQQCWLAAMGP